MKEFNNVQDLVNFEVTEQQTTQEILSAKLGVDNGNFWDVFKRGNTKFRLMIRLLNLLQIDIVLRSKRTGKEYKITQR